VDVRATVLHLEHSRQKTECADALRGCGGADCGYSRRRNRKGSDAGSGEGGASGGCGGNRTLEFFEFDWGADRYLREGVSLPPGAVEMLRDEFDAILFGALGDPRVPTNQHAADILLGLRFKLDLYVNARPVELLHERLTPLRDRTEKDVRIMVFRENTEGLYVGVGGFFRREPRMRLRCRRM